MRKAFFARVGSNQTGNTIPFEYINLDGVDTHLCFVRVETQSRFIEQFAVNGDESPSTQFLHPDFALSGYHLTRGRVLHDTDGVIAGMQRRMAVFPAALRTQLKLTWKEMWNRYESRFRDATKDNDRVHARIALRFFTEATVRSVLATEKIYCNPIEIKWLPHELKSMEGSERFTASPALRMLASDAVRLRSSRFEQLHAIWRCIDRSS